jgi:hypothetical protein
VAVVNGDGSMTLSGTTGSSGDPDYGWGYGDNWIATTSLPSVQWMQFSFEDAGGSGQGARAYASSSVFGGTGELLLQGGVVGGYSSYLTNYSAWVDDEWKGTEWKFPATRTAGIHSTLMGNYTDGKTRIVFDGDVQSVSGSVNPADATYYEPDLFNRAYLGASGVTGSRFSVTYNDFQAGSDLKSTVPGPAAILPFIGGALVALKRRRRR